MEVLMLCIGLGQIVLMGWTLRIMIKSQPSVPREPGVAAKSGLPYWPVIAMALLASVSWVPYVFHLGQPQIAEFIGAWGSTSDGCYQLLDGAKLGAYSDKYNVFLACGIGNPTIDQMQDEVISISNPFTINSGPVSIATKYNQPTLDAIQKLVSISPARPASLWTQSFLFPKSGDISRIKKLADLKEFGGKMIKNCQPIE